MKTARTRNVYINSESHEDGLGRSRIACPPQPFSLQPGEFMRLTLLSFSMARAWTNVNASNNVFYWYAPGADLRYEIAIAEGQYSTHDSLADAVQLALAELFSDNPTCTWDAVSRRLTITTGSSITTVAGGTVPTQADGFFVSYADKTASNLHHDTHHLLGLVPTEGGFGSERNAMLGSTVGPGTHKAVLPPVLQTVDALYLRSTMQSESMQTHNFDSGSPSTQELTHSSIIARIPVVASDEYNDYVRYIESGHQWEVYPLTRQLDHLSFWVTDDKGRNISSLVPGVRAGGRLPFNAAFRWEALVPDLPPRPQPPRDPLVGFYHSALTSQT